MIALKNRIACAVLMSEGDLAVEINSLVFLISENARKSSSGNLKLEISINFSDFTHFEGDFCLVCSRKLLK